MTKSIREIGLIDLSLSRLRSSRRWQAVVIVCHFHVKLKEDV